MYEFESSNQEETERGGIDRVVGGVSVMDKGGDECDNILPGLL